MKVGIFLLAFVIVMTFVIAAGLLWTGAEFITKLTKLL